MSDTYPVEVEKLAPATGRQGAPASGTYGAKAEVDRLRQDLPIPGDSPATPQAQPTPNVGMGPSLSPAPAGGLPSAMFAPTTRPDEPMGTPLSSPAPIASSTPEQRIQMLHSWAQSPNVSQEFREWAQVVLDGMIR